MRQGLSVFWRRRGASTRHGAMRLQICGLVVVLFVIPLWVSSALGAIALDSTSGASIVGSTSLSWTHAVGNGADRLLMVGVSINPAGNAVTSLTYNGTPLIPVGSQQGASGKNRVEIWRLTAPASGSGNIVVTWSGGSADVVGGSASFTGVDPSSPLGPFVSAEGTSNPVTVTLGSAPGDVVFDTAALEAQALSMTVGAGQTQRWNAATGSGGSNVIGGASTEPGAASVTMSWTFVSPPRQWSVGAVSLVPASTHSLSGTVFEDVNYGGGAGRNWATASGSGGVARAAARVELFGNAGAFVTSTTTDGSGNYSFAGLAAAGYTVRVVTSSVTSSRTGYVAGLLPVQTFRTNASTGTAVDATDYVGGYDPATADAGNAAAGWTLNSATGVFSGSGSGKAHAFAPVTVGGVDVTGVDFGWNFDTTVNVNNAGQGSLRQLITNANTLGGDASLAQSGRPAAIENAIVMIGNGTAAAGLRAANNYFTGGVATISPASALPTISTPMILNAQAQPGWTSAPIIELNGTGAGAGTNGFLLTAGNTIVRGFIINRFTANGIQISGVNALVAGNWIGLDATGAIDLGNAIDGITVSANGATIGGSGPADRNVISGNNDEGVDVDNGIAGVVIKGNYIGTNWNGTAAVGNGALVSNSYGGILAEGSVTQIGGPLAGEGNLISGNLNDGINLTGTTHVIHGNRIGTDAAGALAIANSGPGILVGGAGAVNNQIGGGSAGQGNTIAFNTGAGVRLEAGSGTGNAISGNSIFSNGALGVDLNGDGVTANDGAKPAGQPNVLMDFPVFASAGLAAGSLTVAGYVGSAPSQALFANARVEIFKSDNDASGNGEGQTYLGFLTADASGNVSGTVSAPGVVTGDKITGTATDGSGNTSEFGPQHTVTSALGLVKRAFDAGGAAVPSGSVLARGAVVQFLIYVDNKGAATNDMRLSDVLAAGFTYVAGTLRWTNSPGSCSTGTCSPAEEAAIYSSALAGTSVSDAVDGDAAAVVGTTVQLGKENAGNAQVDLAASRVFALTFRAQVR